jgi:hypothetical protein
MFEYYRISNKRFYSRGSAVRQIANGMQEVLSAAPWRRAFAIPFFNCRQFPALLITATEVGECERGWGRGPMMGGGALPCSVQTLTNSDADMNCTTFCDQVDFTINRPDLFHLHTGACSRPHQFSTS